MTLLTHVNKHVDLLLATLDARLNDFQQVLPRLDPRRGLLDLGGLILKQMFGTATVSDLHEVLDELRQKNSDIVHSVSDQLSYVKNLGKINAEAIANLSTVVKEQMIQSHDQLLNLARDMFWLNATFHSESSVVAVIRQLEFTLMQLIQEIDGLVNSVHYAILGKLPIKLMGQVELQGILRNITLLLPEGYELVAGTSKESIHLYYDITKVSILANIRSISLVLTIPLKTADSYFTLFKLIPLPMQIAPDKFVRYSVNFEYLALQHKRRSYLLFTEADYSGCDKGSVTICAAKTTAYNTQTLTCEASLFFRSEEA